MDRRIFDGGEKSKDKVLVDALRLYQVRSGRSTSNTGTGGTTKDTA